MHKLRYLLVLTLFCVAGMGSTSAVAQDTDASQQSNPPQHWRGHGQFDPAKRTEMLTKHLGLTSDQQPKVLDALKSEQSKMEALRSDSSLSQDDRRTKMMDIHKSTNEQVRALLNPDQQKKWDEMQNQHEQWQGHHHDGQKPPSQPDSSDQNK